MFDLYISLSNVAKMIQERMEAKLSLVQLSILHHLSIRKYATMQQVADALRIDNTTFSRQITNLEREGYVARRPYESDKRYFVLGLTGEGEAIVEQLNQVNNVVSDEILRDVSEFERNILTKSMQMLRGRIEGFND